MQIIEKKIGETPLEALEKFRASRADLKKEKLSYIGRLDPMAHGKMLVLIGDENKRREDFLQSNKIYVAQFLIGVATDTHDILGKVNTGDFSSQKKLDETKGRVEIAVANLKKITEQKFPWFSSKHIFGRALFDWFKSGEFDSIERPSKAVKIYSVTRPVFERLDALEVHKIINERISLVSGDFRQTEILQIWQDFFKNSPSEFLTFSIELRVSSGTYIRALCENLSAEIGVPVILFDLERTTVE